MRIIINLLISALAVVLGAYVIPGVEVSSFMYAILVAIIIALLNTFLKPILVVLTIPFTFITLGLFLFVIDAVVILLAGKLLSGFQVAGFWPALFFSIFVGFIGWILVDMRKK